MDKRFFAINKLEPDLVAISIFDDDGGQKMRWVYAGYNGKPTVEEIVRKYSTQLQIWGL